VIFGLVYIGFAFRAEGGALWQRLAVAATGPASAANVSGRGVQIKQAEDGHFWAQVSLNGVSVRALIDSGASVTMISHDVAVAAKIEPSPGPPALVDTANGTIRAQPARIARLSIGAINRNDERAEISDGVSDVSVLGMSFLSGLKSWHVENDTLTLQP
jgi:aspartyl protease family protein